MLLTARNSHYYGRAVRGPAGRFLHDSYMLLGGILTVSRIKYKPEPFVFTSDTVSIDKLLAGDEQLSFDEICEKRAEQALNAFRATGLPNVNIFWSGGIDSTLVVLSLIKFWPTAELKAVSLVATAESIQEYPWFWRSYVRGKLGVVSGNRGPYDRFFDDAMVITGEFGDQIFGSDIVEGIGQKLGFDSVRKDYKDTIVRYFSTIGGEQVANRFFAVFEPIVDEAPFTIKTAVDFLWWWNFSQKFQYVKYRALLFSSRSTIERNRKRIFHFYEGDDFQRWSLAHQSEKMPSDWRSYKWPAKKLIVKWTGDESYLDKLKVRSLANLTHYYESARALTDKFEYVDRLEPFVRSDWSYAE